MASTAKKLDVQHSLKLVIDRAIFLKSLGRLQSIVEKRNTIPILANIKLEADSDGLILTATDMDLAAIEKIAAQVSLTGAVTVPAHTLYDIVRKLPDGSQIALESDPASGQMRVEAGKSKFSLSYLPAEEFPVMNEGDMSHEFTIASKDLVNLIEKTRFAMSTEETRYYLNGVYLHAAEDQKGNPVLKTVATDGHRLALIETALPEGAAGMPGVIVPRKAVAELKKLLEEAGKEVEVALSDAKIRFTAGNVTIISKLIDGTFPDYERVIPENNNNIMEVDTRLFAHAVDRVSTITTEKTRAIKFSLEQGKITLSAHSPESGTAEEEVSANYSADRIDIGFNARYILEMMGQLEGETAQFVFSDSASPVLVRDPADVGALYVVMPMRV